MIDLHQLNQHRLVASEIVTYGTIGDAGAGIFGFRSPIDRKVILRCVASSGDGWDHVSVSPNRRRCPTWEEMEMVKRTFFKPDEVAMQLHVAPDDHINCHPHCLHIWRPHDAQIPLPPPIMVGPSEDNAA